MKLPIDTCIALRPAKALEKCLIHRATVTKPNIGKGHLVSTNHAITQCDPIIEQMIFAGLGGERSVGPAQLGDFFQAFQEELSLLLVFQR